MLVAPDDTATPALRQDEPVFEPRTPHPGGAARLAPGQTSGQNYPELRGGPGHAQNAWLHEASTVSG